MLNISVQDSYFVDEKKSGLFFGSQLIYDAISNQSSDSLNLDGTFFGESSGLVVRRRSQEVRHLSSIPASPKCLVPRIQKGANTQAVSGSAIAVSFREL